jgi:hypothetical protein
MWFHCARRIRSDGLSSRLGEKTKSRGVSLRRRERKSLAGSMRGMQGMICPKFIIPSMDTTEIIQTIDAEIARLEKARSLLNGDTTSPTKRGRPPGSSVTARAKPRRKMSAEGRARIAAAQKARWAKAKKT